MTATGRALAGDPFPSRPGRPARRRLQGIDLPLPPAFVVPYGPGSPAGSAGGSLERRLAGLEAALGRRLGDPHEPLLVSVAATPPVSSGAGSAFSHVGLCDTTVAGYRALIGDEGVAWSRYERLVRAFGVGVRGVAAARLAPPPAGAGIDAVQARVRCHRATIAEATGRPFPQDPARQVGEIVAALIAAGRSAGGAGSVTVQAMAHGDAVGMSGAGTVFTRNPATGERWMAGEFFPGVERAQPGGDDDGAALTVEQLARAHPVVYGELQRVAGRVEEGRADLTEIDFVVERSRLWVIDVRSAPHSAVAALATALDLWHRGTLDLTGALDRIPPVALIRALEPGLETAGALALGRGVGVSPGVAVGPLVLSARRARQLAAPPAISPILAAGEDAEAGAVLAAGAVVSSGGGHASHLAALARGLEHPAVCRLPGLVVGSRQARFGSVVVPEGQDISVDGSTGEVFLGVCPRTPRGAGDELVELLLACDGQRHLPLLAEGSRAAWADGIFDPAVTAVCRSPGDVDAALAADQPVAISPGPHQPLRLVEIAGELAGYGIEVMLRVDRGWPRSLVRLPPVPWSAVIATPEAAATGRMLAARLAPASGPGGRRS